MTGLNPTEVNVHVQGVVTSGEGAPETVKESGKAEKKDTKTKAPKK